MKTYTKNLTELKKNGFTVIKNVLSSKECKKYIKILQTAYDKHKINYAKNKKQKVKLNIQSEEKLIYNLHNKHPKFLKLLNLNPIFFIVEKYLNSGSYNKNEIINLRQFTGRSPNSFKGEQQLHLDSRVPGCSFPLMAVVAWLLEDFTKLNGATKYVPYSHKKKYYPKDNHIYKNEKIITAKRGSVIIMDGGLWHGGSLNKSEKTRWSILSTYVRYFYKPAFDFSKNTPKNIFKKLTFKQKEILGLTSIPPIDEFNRISSISKKPYSFHNYKFPNKRS